MTTLLPNFYRQQIKSSIAGCVWTVSSPHNTRSPFIFCSVCDQIAFDVTSFFPSVIYRSVSRGLGRHSHNAFSAETPGKCFPDWCRVSFIVVTHRRDSHLEIPPVMDWSQTRVDAFDTTALCRSEGNDGTTAKRIYYLYLSPHKRVEFVEMLT